MVLLLKLSELLKSKLKRPHVEEQPRDYCDIGKSVNKSITQA
jgi:hypothetical protein